MLNLFLKNLFHKNEPEFFYINNTQGVARNFLGVTQKFILFYLYRTKY